jgi:hypothetical protein
VVIIPQKIIELDAMDSRRHSGNSSILAKGVISNIGFVRLFLGHGYDWPMAMV